MKFLIAERELLFKAQLHKLTVKNFPQINSEHENTLINLHTGCKNSGTELHIVITGLYSMAQNADSEMLTCTA
jgi:hypothetical protein